MKKPLLNLTLKIVRWINDSTADSISGLIATSKLSLIITPVIFIWEKLSKWGVKNEDYILIVLGAILVDWFFGTLKHLFFTGTFSFKKNAIGITTKLLLATAGGFLFEGLSFLVSSSDYLLSTTQIVTRVIILMYPGMSAFENIYIVSGERFPPKIWMERLTNWKKTLNPNDLFNSDTKNPKQ